MALGDSWIFPSNSSACVGASVPIPTIELDTTRSDSVPLEMWTFAAVLLVRPILTLSAPSVPSFRLSVHRMSSDPAVYTCEVLIVVGWKYRSPSTPSVPSGASVLTPSRLFVSSTVTVVPSTVRSDAMTLPPDPSMPDGLFDTFMSLSLDHAFDDGATCRAGQIDGRDAFGAVDTIR